MNAQSQSQQTPLSFVDGQMWKVDDAYLQVVEPGKRLTHYRMMRHPDQEATWTRMIGTDALAVYLRMTGAVQLR
jgi:hypothetical protein